MAQRDENLVFGILALQLRLVTPQQLVSAGAGWAADPQHALGDIRLDQGALTAGQHNAISKLIHVQLAAHGADVSQIYELYGGDATLPSRRQVVIRNVGTAQQCGHGTASG